MPVKASRAPRVTERADLALSGVHMLSNPYLVGLADGTMPLEGFRRSQEQFFFAVSFFSRPMAALVGRIPDPKQRLDILHNLVEEHGEFHEPAFHHNTFLTFLHSLGSTVTDIRSLTIAPALRAFNAVLTAACVLDELEVGVSCMGVIEHAFSAISAAIGKGVVARGWVKAGELVHYKLHAEIDERHAEEFFAVVEPLWGDLSRRHFIEQGLDLGAYVFDRLYRDLHRIAVTG
jgi:pyrroloquinoline-quinone synthase